MNVSYCLCAKTCIVRIIRSNGYVVLRAHIAKAELWVQEREREGRRGSRRERERERGREGERERGREGERE